MMGPLLIALLGSLALFLGLSSLARRRLRGAAPGAAALLLTVLAALGMLWLIQGRYWSHAVSALLIGLLGYCFGHFTTARVKSVVGPGAEGKSR